ncbi:MAG: N-acetylmuramoyl-L-alanine amidase [Muribaculaceae bacterium]|nr:N-acetylmuramoyl-L-alanine amidase [Muribaculaceae bacterium]
MLIRKIYIVLLLATLSILFGNVTVAKGLDDKKFTVVIDAGHGGKDIGASDNGVMEKNINLKVAKQLEALIKKKLKNTSVVMTREGDSYLTLQQRADKANKARGDLFISIHTNSVDKRNRNRKTVAGSSVYTLGLHKDENNLEVAMRENSVIELERDYAQKYSGFDPQKDESYIIFEMAQKRNLSQSIMFAETVEKELVKSGRKDRGVHQAGFWVLWATSMPSVLIELDFICNPESAKYMASDKGAKEMAEAIFKAIEKYEDGWRKSLRGSDGGSLADIYISGDPGNLEESFTIATPSGIATARTRTHKSSASSTESPRIKKSGERRRRSSRAKQVSMNKSFEESSLVFPESKNYAVASMEVNDNLAPAAQNTPPSKMTKAEKKRKEKEEKEAKKLQKNLEKQQKKERRKGAHNAKITKLSTLYAVQVLASKDLLNTDSERFCGLSPISVIKDNNFYKYLYGESEDKAELETVLQDVKKKIPDAFIVTIRK